MRRGAAVHRRGLALLGGAVRPADPGQDERHGLVLGRRGVPGRLVGLRDRAHPPLDGRGLPLAAEPGKVERDGRRRRRQRVKAMTRAPGDAVGPTASATALTLPPAGAGPIAQGRGDRDLGPAQRPQHLGDQAEFPSFAVRLARA
jgi:hypothetical protein